ncbi:tetratricopeptide repeat protein [Mucilaginibacter sp. S1162]|uniref:Tetratricopeptide repeat protein n=1 Tax=Mucilaginibacter humi TaxID=2732510 RepID=A0ABX1W3G6_9SPHI|nr:tetratricopeptide repeat protein [Mucilaginibacter humi]NNU34723.1 tetratricopeptide repeat protein [Mucilaginibacter humi]
MRDTIPAKTLPLYATAEEALKNAIAADAAGENKAIISEAKTSLAQYQLNKGIKDFQAKSYDEAYKAFNNYQTLFPEDTTAIYYTGLAAVQAKNFPAALTNYNKLLPSKFSKKESIYLDMSTIALQQNDTTNALKYASEGVEKFPSNSDLRRREIEISLQTGKAQEVVGKIQAAIANDPKNKTLYYYAGLTYTSFGNSIADEIYKLKKADGGNLKESTLPAFLAKLTPLQTKKDDYMSKAAEMYKKALEIDPNYYEANLNLGYALLSPAIDTYNYANNYLPASKQKEYNATLAKATTMFDAAKPYLLKAVELKPTSADALRNLKNYYLGTRNTTEANAIQKQIDALPK